MDIWKAFLFFDLDSSCQAILVRMVPVSLARSYRVVDRAAIPFPPGAKPGLPFVFPDFRAELGSLPVRTRLDNSVRFDFPVP